MSLVDYSAGKSPPAINVEPTVRPKPPTRLSDPASSLTPQPVILPDDLRLSHKRHLPRYESTAARGTRKFAGFLVTVTGLLVMGQAFFSKGWAGRGFQAIGVFLAGFTVAILGASLARD